MKVYKASALAHQGRSEILDEAMEDGVVINRCATNGKVLNSMVIISKEKYDDITEGTFQERES